MSIPSPGLALTPDQLFSLAAIALQEKPRNPSPPHALRPALDLLQTKWVRDFLFTPSPIHIPHLLSPSLESSALTCIMQSASVNPLGQPPLSPNQFRDGYLFSGYILFAPVFTADHLTVGVGVVDSDKTTGVSWLAKTAPEEHVTLNVRFARDEVSRTLMLVYDLPRDDRILVYTSRLDSPRMSTKMSAIFDRETLRSDIFRIVGDLHAADLSSGLVSLQEETHHRSCAICRLPETSPCLCQFPNLIAGHPFDAEFFLRAMSMHAGISEAAAHKVLFRGLGRPQTTVLGARTLLRGISNAKITLKLRDWSVQQHVRELREHPWQGLLSMGESEHAQRDVLNDGDASGLLGSSLPAQQRTALLPNTSPVSTEPQGMLCADTTPDMPVLSVNASFEIGKRPTGERDDANPQQGSQSGYVEEGGAWWDGEHNPQQLDKCANSPHSNFPSTERHSHPSMLPISLEELGRERAKSVSVVEAREFGPSEAPGRHQSSPAESAQVMDIVTPERPQAEQTAQQSQVKTRVTARRIAPRLLPAAESDERPVSAASTGNIASNVSPKERSTGQATAKEQTSLERGRGPSRSVSPTVPGVKITDPDLLERRRKAQIRRERNRAAARRSNLKQKAVRDGLKVKLREVTDRVEALRNRELELRKENLELRRALGTMVG